MFFCDEHLWLFVDIVKSDALTERQSKPLMPQDPSDYIRSLAQEHLGDAEGSSEALLRRLDQHIQRQQQEIERLREKEDLAATCAEVLREGLNGTEETVDSLKDSLSGVTHPK